MNLLWGLSVPLSNTARQEFRASCSAWQSQHSTPCWSLLMYTEADLRLLCSIRAAPPPHKHTHTPVTLWPSWTQASPPMIKMVCLQELISHYSWECLWREKRFLTSRNSVPDKEMVTQHECWKTPQWATPRLGRLLPSGSGQESVIENMAFGNSILRIQLSQ